MLELADTDMIIDGMSPQRFTGHQDVDMHIHSQVEGWMDMYAYVPSTK